MTFHSSPPFSSSTPHLIRSESYLVDQLYAIYIFLMLFTFVYLLKSFINSVFNHFASFLCQLVLFTFALFCLPLMGEGSVTFAASPWPQPHASECVLAFVDKQYPQANAICCSSSTKIFVGPQMTVSSTALVYPCLDVDFTGPTLSLTSVSLSAAALMVTTNMSKLCTEHLG